MLQRYHHKVHQLEHNRVLVRTNRCEMHISLLRLVKNCTKVMNDIEIVMGRHLRYMHASGVRGSLLDKCQIVFFRNRPEIITLYRLVGALGSQGIEFYLQQFGLVQGLELHGLGGGECTRSTITTPLQGHFEEVQVIVKFVFFPMGSIAS